MFTFLVLRSYTEASVTFRNMATTAQSAKVWESFAPFAIHGRGDKPNCKHGVHDDRYGNKSVNLLNCNIR
jgi:hypothetical protein